MPEVVSAFRSFWVGNCAAVSDGWSGVCARTAPGTVAIAVPMRAMAATVQRLKRFENIGARLELVVPGFAEGRIACERGRWHGDPEPSGRQCRFWRFTARIRAGRSPPHAPNRPSDRSRAPQDAASMALS